MRASLQRWINNADTARHLRHFQFAQLPIELAPIDHRLDDYYISLVGELFANLHQPEVAPADWAQLGNAFLQFSVEMTEDQLRDRGISREDAALFASAAFYFGDFPASACLAMRRSAQPADGTSLRAACYDFLARPRTLQSDFARGIQEELKAGDLNHIALRGVTLREREARALEEGPEIWIVARLLRGLLERFQQTNLRAVLPQGAHPFWDAVGAFAGRPTALELGILSLADPSHSRRLVDQRQQLRDADAYRRWQNDAVRDPALLAPGRVSQ